MRKLLVFILIFAISLLLVDRVVANIYLPKKGDTEVIIYTTDWCPYCEALRKTLDAYEIEYTDHDTESSLSGVLGFWALGGRGVPVAVIGEEIIHGYDSIAVTDALVSVGYEIPAEW